MKVFIARGQEVELADRHFIAEGGEGRLYGRGKWAYKIYLDPAHTMPAAKLDELQVLERDNIARPRRRLHDRDGHVVGFAMAKIENAVALPRLFTNDYRDRVGIDAQSTLRLVVEISRTIEFIHGHRILMVDGNEFNYLVGRAGHAKPYFIDVDSYQTPTFAATAIMPSIRDWTRADFNEATDWFSFAVIAFQLFVGIHPYKGRHADFKRGDFAARVRAGISVFNPAVTMPGSARGLNHIPSAYRRWLEAVFERGERSPPPTRAGHYTPGAIAQRVVGAGSLRLRVVRTLPERIQNARSVAGTLLLVAGRRLYINNTRYTYRTGEEIMLCRPDQALAFSLDKNRLRVRELGQNATVPTVLSGKELLRVDNRIYLLHGENLAEVRVLEVGGRQVIGQGRQWKILPNAAKLFAGVIMLDVMGRTHAVLPFRQGATAITHLPELDGHRLVDCGYERGVLVVTAATRDGRYHRFLFRFNAAHDDYDLSCSKDGDAAVNFTVLDSGVGLQIVDDGELRVFSNHPGSANARVVKDDAVKAAWPLFNHDGRAAFVEGRNVYVVSQG